MKFPLLSFFFCFLQVICTVSAQSNFADCTTARVLCGKDPIFISSLPGYGSSPESFADICFGDHFAETNSIWLKWQAAESGTLDFTILPLNEADDIDFALYRLDNFDNCLVKEPLRCMAAGPSLGDEDEFSHHCTGATGLRLGTDATSRSSGCASDNDNFLRPVEITAGEYYMLFINNFHSAEGILIEWGGMATFQQIPGKCLPKSNLSSSSTIENGGRVQFSDAFPNPATNQVSITVLSDQEHSGQLQVISSDGQLEITMPFTLSAGSSTLDLPTEKLRPGVYFLKLRTSAETHILRFVKQ